LVVVSGITTVVNSTLGSSLPSGDIQFIAKSFNISNEQELVLPISIFLVGYIVGPLAFGPLSETYGRKILMILPFAVFTAFTLGCALAPSWPVFVIFRFIYGVVASAPISVVGGLFADINQDPVTRGRAMAAFMTATVCGPILSTIFSGFVSPVSWRWSFWIGLIIIGVCWIPLAFLPESYGPIILKQRARKLRKETGDQTILAPIELEKKGAKQMITVTLARPLRMFFLEWIVLFSRLDLSLVYSIFYLYFEAYPLIFERIYKLNTGESGLAFLPSKTSSNKYD
jgi:multidrug resistance protein